MSKNSILADLHKLFEVDLKGKSYFSHMLVAMEVSEDGTPVGAVVKMKCSPILALGIIDLLHEKLSEARDQVLEQLASYEKENMQKQDCDDEEDLNNPEIKELIQNALQSLSDDDKEFFVDSQRRAMAALLANDEQTLKAIIAEMRAFVDSKKKNGGNDSKDFDINDFKGSF